jgi:DNA-binding MarR family transcriptional regulator
METGLKQHQTFGFLLKDVNRLNVQRFEQRAAALRLTLSQCRVLLHIANNEGTSQVQLAGFTDIEPMTLVRILDRMESDGWLERRIDPVDRRARSIFLTAKGKPLVDEIWRMVEQTRQEAFAGISNKRAALLISLLQKVRENFASLEPLSLATLPVHAENLHRRSTTGARATKRNRAIAQS